MGHIPAGAVANKKRMNKIALVIIYNHQYNKNIDLLERIYHVRFRHIYHLVPFYRGNRKNVIPVYENSFQFQGYIAQGMKSFFKAEYTHYFFVADDLMINPIINENNFASVLKIKKNDCFFPEFVELNKCGEWARAREAYQWTIAVRGIEAQGQLPHHDQALEKLKRLGLDAKPLGFEQIWWTPKTLKDYARIVVKKPRYPFLYLANKLFNLTYALPYPLVGGYSDIFAVSAATLREFCHYCGVFSATGLHVEVGLPTALVLTTSDIVTEKNIKLKGRYLWSKEDYHELDRYDLSLDRLLAEFPKDYLCLHPVKLSQWKTRL